MLKTKVTLGYFQETQAMRRRVNWVLQSGRLSYGPESRKFEAKLSEIMRVERTILCNSGTSALVVALQALKEQYGWEDGAEVICPALTFVATINAVLHCHLTPVLVDVDPKTYCMDPVLIGKALSERTVALLPVHLFGHPAEMSTIIEIADNRGLVIVEDCCEAFGAEYHDIRVGSFGHVGCFSTYVGHHIVTGVGGFCITDELELADHIRSLVNHGINISELPVGDPYEPSHLGRVFNFTSIGHSFRITEMESAIGNEQLVYWEDKIEARRRNAELLTVSLNGEDDFTLPTEQPLCKHSYMVYPIVHHYLPAHECIRILNEHGIEARLMMPLTNQPCYRQFEEDDFPNASRINMYGFYVGCHEGIVASDIEYMAQVIKENLVAPF